MNGQWTLSIDRFLTIIGILAVGLVPFVAPSFLMDLFALSMIFAIFAISVDLIWGFAGILTFGHAVFFGTGAYVMAKLIPVGATGGVIVAIGIPGIIGLILAGVLFRRGIDAEYFAIISLAFAVIASQLATSWAEVTGGSNGLLVPSPRLKFLGLVSIPIVDTGLYYGIVIGLVIVYIGAKRVVRSPFGLVLGGIDQNEAKARSLGYDVAKYKTVIFGLSSGLAGFAGALYTSHAGFVSPPLLGFGLSTSVLIWVLVGGRGTLIGPVIGAVFITLFENVISGVFVFWWTLLLGTMLVLVVLVFPSGIIGVVRVVTERAT